MSKLATISIGDLDNVTGGDGLSYIDCVQGAANKATNRTVDYAIANPFSSWRSDRRAVNTFASALNKDLSVCKFWEAPIDTGPRTDL
jgi:hypothetical protein